MPTDGERTGGQRSNELPDALRALDAAAVAELAWLAADGRPRAVPVVPHTLNGAAALAVPYAYAGWARAVAAAPCAALVLSDPRLAGRAWRALAVLGRPALVEDTDGTVFVERLLDAELRKHPPARALADSPLLRREHWWYLPRLVLTLAQPEVVPITERLRPGERVLAAASGPGRLEVRTVSVHADRGDRDRWGLTLLGPGGLPAGPAPTALLGHDFAVPDLERWTHEEVTGTLADDVLTVQTRRGTLDLPRVPGLLARMRRQWALERGCRRALRAVGG